MLVTTILAGCGGGTKLRVVGGDGFTFEAPSDWKVASAGRRTAASHGDETLVVTTLPLARAYTPDLFDAVQPEIDRVATALKEQLHATLTGRTLEVSGRRSWQYDLVYGDVFEQVTFVLRGKREFQLYCRRAKDESNRSCAKFVSSFRLR